MPGLWITSAAFGADLFHYGCEEVHRCIEREVSMSGGLSATGLAPMDSGALVRAAAERVRSDSWTVLATSRDVHRDWQGMGWAYQAPELPEVWAAPGSSSPGVRQIVDKRCGRPVGRRRRRGGIEMTR